MPCLALWIRQEGGRASMILTMIEAELCLKMLAGTHIVAMAACL